MNNTKPKSKTTSATKKVKPTSSTEQDNVQNTKAAAVKTEKQLRQERIAQRKREAEKYRLVQVTCLEPRDAAVSTTAVATCANEFFDLGTVIVPLKQKTKVRQGHLNSLQEAQFVSHDASTNDTSSGGNSTGGGTSLNRYSIQYLD